MHLPSSHSAEFTNFKGWAYAAFKCLLIVWIVVQMSAFAVSRYVIFDAEMTRVVDRLGHTNKACYGKCLGADFSKEDPDFITYCRDSCEFAHSGTSPFMEGIRAVADSTFLCGARPCVEAFGIYQILAVVGFLYASRLVLSYSATSLMARQYPHKKTQ